MNSLLAHQAGLPETNSTINELLLNKDALKGLARDAHSRGLYSIWSYWMNELKLIKAEIKKAALSSHWYLWLAGKTKVRPSIDMPITDMLPSDLDRLMNYYAECRSV